MVHEAEELAVEAAGRGAPLAEAAVEIEAAEQGVLPEAVRIEDVRGDLHVHTTLSGDGRSTLEEIVASAAARGYEYLAICDHTRAVTVVPGLGPDDVRRQAEEIAEVNELVAPFRVLRGMECDILADG